MHSKKPSIDSRTFVIEGDSSIQIHTENTNENENNNETEEEGIVSDIGESSTDSYDDLDNESLENIQFDSAKYLTESLQTALSSLEFNKSLAIQAQTSGKLKAKELELISLQKEAQKKLEEFQKKFQNGNKLIQQVKKDLKWSEHKVKQLQSAARMKYPVEYSQSRDKVVNRTTATTENQDQEMYI